VLEADKVNIAVLIPTKQGIKLAEEVLNILSDIDARVVQSLTPVEFTFIEVGIKVVGVDNNSGEEVEGEPEEEEGD
jgi:hypothetical protein